MARYRKKPVEVEAFLFGVDNMPDWFMDKVTSKDVVLHRIPFDEARARNYGQMWCDIKTLEGTMRAYEGKDYIIKGIKGEIYPCKVDIFEETYEIPTADVVPKSTIESIITLNSQLEAEVYTLKDNNEHLAVMLEETKAQKDALIKNYAECMKDYASEIFADVNMRIISYSTDIYIKGEELIIIPKSDYNAILAALIKKYTAGEDKPASEEKYFSPGDVAKMTHQEVREKYSAIRRSMERW